MCGPSALETGVAELVQVPTPPYRFQSMSHPSHLTVDLLWEKRLSQNSWIRQSYCVEFNAWRGGRWLWQKAKERRGNWEICRARVDESFRVAISLSAFLQPYPPTSSSPPGQN